MNPSTPRKNTNVAHDAGFSYALTTENTDMTSIMERKPTPRMMAIRSADPGGRSVIRFAALGRPIRADEIVSLGPALILLRFVGII
jgi:hypothetical protein